VRANVERNRSLNHVPEPSPRMPPEEARAQIVNLESQIERLQLQLLENRLHATRPPSRTSRASVADESPFRRSMFRRRNSLADSTTGDPWTERNSRGLWRLDDNGHQDGDSDLESLHSSEPRRQLFEAHRAAHYARSPPEVTAANPAAARERFRAIWGDIDTDDYVSPITSL
jgi:hypothetical protein